MRAQGDFRVETVANDHHCLFRSVASIRHDHYATDDEMQHERDTVVRLVRERWGEYQALLGVDYENANAYARKMLGNAWGGGFELNVFATHYGINFHVVYEETREYYIIQPADGYCFNPITHANYGIISGILSYTNHSHFNLMTAEAPGLGGGRIFRLHSDAMDQVLQAEFRDVRPQLTHFLRTKRRLRPRACTARFISHPS